MMNSPFLTRARRMRDGDDSGAAMITALLAILVTAMFSIVMLGVIMSQITPTQLQQATTRTVFASEAGINVVVGQIRAAADSPDGLGNIYGKIGLLPCSSTGTVGSGTAALGYSVKISYFTEDPTSQPDTWRISHALTCSPGSGPSQIPTHALLESTGTGLVVRNVPGFVQRAVEAVYAFQISNTNIPGGFIKTFNGAKPNDPGLYCLQASKLDAGAVVNYVDQSNCVDGNVNNPKQLWIYAKDYTIKLAYSTLPTSGLPSPLCMTGAPGAVATRITLQPCVKATDANGYNQLWSWMDDPSWQGETSSLTKSAYRLGTGTPDVVGTSSYLQIVSGTGGNTNEWDTFDPDPRIGAGAAGKSTKQIVNYQEFGRCADVTDQNFGRPMEIAYPCKQDPNPSQSELLWNHKWVYNEPVSGMGSVETQITVTNGGDYCLTSYNTPLAFPNFTTCSTSRADQKWTRVQKMDSYDDSYLFKDAYSKCLDLGPSYNDGARTHPYSTLQMKDCSPSLSQKWNAIPNAAPAALGNYWEIQP